MNGSFVTFVAGFVCHGCVWGFDEVDRPSRTGSNQVQSGADGKKVKGRKRHLLVDTLGLILGIIVTAADTGDRQGSRALLLDYCAKGVRRLRKIWADGNYTGG
jgi:hypothetical protein